MAALPAGVQFALSSESSYKENKELVFVKLTDSALKAIEDFIRNNRVSTYAILLTPKQANGVRRHTYITSNQNETANIVIIANIRFYWYLSSGSLQLRQVTFAKYMNSAMSRHVNI